MSSSYIDRKIAVIFATDLVGYSKHMEKDEDATLASLNACNKIIEPIIKKQKGRIFNTDEIFFNLNFIVSSESYFIRKWTKYGIFSFDSSSNHCSSIFGVIIRNYSM